MRRILVALAVIAAVLSPSAAHASFADDNYGTPPRGCYTKTEEVITYKKHTRVVGRAVANCKPAIELIENNSWIEIEVPRKNRKMYWDMIGTDGVDDDKQYTRTAPTAPLFVGKHRYRTCAGYTFTTNRDVVIVFRCSEPVTITRYMPWEKR